MCQAVVDAVHPEKVVLFGSYARGDFTANSDVDLLIIEREPFDRRSRRKELAKIRQALAGFAVPKDLLLFTPEEVAEWRDATNHVIACALREGKVMHG